MPEKAPIATNLEEPMTSVTLAPRTIWKYPLASGDEQSVGIPQGAKVLHAGLDPSGQPCICAEVDPAGRVNAVKIHMRGTGHPLQGNETAYIGSFVDRSFVWHVYI
jgi:hypothetical protein